MTVDEQLAEWVKGNPIHNDELMECCPDFSCCQLDLLADEKTRKVFVAANEEDRFKMLGMFLGSAISALPKSGTVYLAGIDDPGNRVH